VPQVRVRVDGFASGWPLVMGIAPTDLRCHTVVVRRP
jgi:hypothetical protein